MSDSLDEIFDTSLNESDSAEEKIAGANFPTESETNEVSSEGFKSPILKKVFKGKELNELKRAQTQRIIALRQKHMNQEQTISDANDLKFRDFIWEMTLNYFGRGSFITDLRPLFEQKLVEEEYQLKKEILELQESQKEEIRTAKQMKSEQQMKARNQKLIDPKEFAQQIFAQIQDFDDGDDVYENDAAIDAILNKITEKNEDESVSSIEGFEAVFVSPPKPKRPSPQVQNFSPLSSSSTPSIISSPQTPPNGSEKKQKRRRPVNAVEPPPRYVHSPQPMTMKKRPNRMLQRHIRERNKLKKSMEETDKFMQNMKKQAWFGDFL